MDCQHFFKKKVIVFLKRQREEVYKCRFIMAAFCKGKAVKDLKKGDKNDIIGVSVKTKDALSPNK